MLALETIEAFFGKSFEFADKSLSDTRWLTHFDGFIYWQVVWFPKDKLLWMAADRESPATPFPILEIGGCYMDATIKPLTGGYNALVLVPNNAEDPNNYLVITKTNEGRLSLSTSVGVTENTS